jgi:uncharacterized repeat protein (TIGR01451 family)
VTDRLPAGLSFVSATPAVGTYNPATGVWTVGFASATSIYYLDIDATVVAGGSITNTASITTSDQFDPVTSNNSASVTLTGQQADLALAKAVDNQTPHVGATVTFTVTLTNLGPTTATGVLVTDPLPGGHSFVSATPSPGTTYNSATGLWTVGTVTTTPPRTLSIRATVVASGSISNTATITASDQPDPNTANDRASATLTVAPAADLAVTKTVDNPTPNVGQNVTFTITVTNHGPDIATGVTISDPLAAGLSFVSYAASSGGYNSGTGLWTVGTVAVGTPQTLTVTVAVTATGELVNTASIAHSDQFDPVPGNNSDSVAVRPAEADLALTKTVNDPTPTGARTSSSRSRRPTTVLTPPPASPSATRCRRD